jgi:hypothetical protein
VEETNVFDGLGNMKYKEKEHAFTTLTPKLLCGENFIKTDEALIFLFSKAHRNLGILEGMVKAMSNIGTIESIHIKKEALRKSVFKYFNM